jgi:hypothetical protein
MVHLLVVQVVIHKEQDVVSVMEYINQIQKNLSKKQQKYMEINLIIQKSNTKNVMN